MRVSHDEENKIVQLWLTNKEREQEGFFDMVKSISHNYKNINRNYKTVIYVSGMENVVKATADLLKHNKCPSA